MSFPPVQMASASGFVDCVWTISPASWMTMIGKTCPVRARAFSWSWDKRARRAAMSPLGTECFDIFSPLPGAREVMIQVERLSSRETKIALRSVRTATCSGGRGQRACMVAPEWVVQHPHSARERGATNRAHGIFKGRHFEAALTVHQPRLSKEMHHWAGNNTNGPEVPSGSPPGSFC